MQTKLKLVVTYIVNQIERSQHAGQKQHGYAQHQIPGIGHSLQAVPGTGPLTDDGLHARAHGSLVDHKIGTVEECAHGNADQQGAKHAVDDQKTAIDVT